MKEKYDLVKRESAIILVLFVILLILAKILFYKESFLVVLRTVFALFWLFILPGYAVLLYWSKELELVERFIIAFLVGAGLIGAFGYYIGIMGINMKYAVYFPIIPIVLGYLFYFRRK